MNGLVIVLIMAASLAADTPEETLADIARMYDVARAEQFAQAMEASQEPGQELLRAKAWLLTAELQRLDYEGLDLSESKARRAIGRKIDEAAERGQAAAEQLEESSETYRIKADLLGTTIRSDYRAGKHKGELRKLIESALELDSENPLAHVAMAKFWILRAIPKPDEIEAGQQCLEKALTLDSDLEPARLLQAYANELSGDESAARAQYQYCLDMNPACSPAREGLRRTRGHSE